MQKAEITERCVEYSLRIIKLYRELEKDSVGRIIGKQLLRSGTSIGANVHEAQGAQSKASKISVAQKEAHESSYWLRIIAESGIVPGSRLSDLSEETGQIIRILSAILISSKQRRISDAEKMPCILILHFAFLTLHCFSVLFY